MTRVALLATGILIALSCCGAWAFTFDSAPRSNLGGMSTGCVQLADSRGMVCTLVSGSAGAVGVISSDSDTQRFLSNSGNVVSGPKVPTRSGLVISSAASNTDSIAREVNRHRTPLIALVFGLGLLCSLLMVRAGRP